jgi:hypothetical protein
LLPSANEQQQQQVQAMYGPAGSSAGSDIPEALNLQYEATLPQYKSRIYGEPTLAAAVCMCLPWNDI